MKILSALLLAIGLLTLSGCGLSDAPPPPPPIKVTALPNTPANDDSLAKVKQRGVIRWGADANGGSAPFVFTNPDDLEKIIGFEVEIMDKLSAYMGVKPELVSGPWDTLPSNLLANRTDMVMNGLEVNEERKKKVSFSEPYYCYEQQLTVRAADKDKYKSLEDLKGKKMAILSGAESKNVLKAAGFAEDLITELEDSFTPYKNLDLGRVEAVLQESLIAAHYANPTKMPSLLNIPKTFAPGKYAVATRLEDRTLMVEINRILDMMKKNGELAAIYKKWNIMTESQNEVGVHEKK